MAQVCIRTSSEPPSAGTSGPVCLELLGSGGSSGAISLAREAFSGCFAAGAASVFQLEAPAVGELQQLHIWVDVDGAGGLAWPCCYACGESACPRRAAALVGGLAAVLLIWPWDWLRRRAGAAADASWHLDSVEVACEGRPPAYFVCRKWLNAGCGYSAELAASSRNPRQEEAEYKVGGWGWLACGLAAWGQPLCLACQAARHLAAGTPHTPPCRAVRRSRSRAVARHAP